MKTTEKGEKEDAEEGRQDENDENQFDHQTPRHAISQSTCRMISYITQFMVASFAIAAFIVAVLYSVNNLTKRQILESKDAVTMNEAWFKFALCLRPLMTASLLKEVYENKWTKSFDERLDMLQFSEKERWSGSFILDEELRWDDYKSYLETVHPWISTKEDEIFPIEKLWNYLNDTIKESFVEFRVNKKRINGTNSYSSQSLTAEKHMYTVLPSVRRDCDSCKKDALHGKYTLSPLYAGCVNVTVNQPMSKRQMEISIKFRNSRHKRSAKNTTQVDMDSEEDQVTLFQAVDLFVFHAKEHFTEIPIIHQFNKFSVLANSLERLLVRGSSHEQQPALMGDTCVSNPLYSITNCRYECIMKALFSAIKCTLPWMEALRYKPWANEKHRNTPKCAEANSFIDTLHVQGQYLHFDGGDIPEPVSKCIKECPQPCITYKVDLLSLGGKSIGKNFGISLTVSPELSVVREYYDYDFTNMIAELSASISFLLGLSAIAIYDWLFAFAAWAAVKLGLIRADREAPQRSPSDDSDAEVAA